MTFTNAATIIICVVMTAAVGGQPQTSMEARGQQAVSESRVGAEAAWSRMRTDSRMAQLWSLDGADSMNLGTPVPVFWLSMQSVSEVASGKVRLEDVARNDEVVFPVMNSNGSGNSVLVMARSEQGWRRDVVGRTELARSLVAVRNGDISRTKNKSESYFAVEVPSLQRIFLARGNGDAAVRIPLDSEERLKLTAGTPMPVRTLMQTLQDYAAVQKKQ